MSGDEPSVKQLGETVVDTEAMLAEAGARARLAEKRTRQVETELEGFRQARGLLLESLRKTTSSPSWKVTRLLRSLRRLIRPASLTETQLSAASPMEILGSGKYRALTSNPMFIVSTVPMEGWIRVELELVTPARSDAGLYYDTGSLFNDGERFNLGLVEGETKRDVLLQLPAPTHAFRLDPIRVPEEFTIRRFRITPMSGAAVDLRSLKKRWEETRAGRPLKTSLKNGLSFLAKRDLHGFRNKLRAALSASVVDTQANYDTWRRKRELTDERRRDLRDEAAAMRNPPLISVIMPTYNTPEQWLRAAIDSVLKQTYPHWELCIADDASTEPHVRRVLEEYAARDSRIRVEFRATNGHISAASNTCIAMAKGEFVAFLDHDDEYAEHALSRVAQEIVAHPTVDMIYSDEDKITVAGRHRDPFFKPDYSPEYLQACMYTCHLTVYRTALVRDVGGFRSEFDQAQDYDLVFRITARTDRVRHIPDVLYSWRMIPTSTASGAEAKPIASTRARKALQAAADATGRGAKVVDGPTEGYHRVKWDIIGKPLVSVVIPTASGKADIRGEHTWFVLKCVESIRKLSTYERIEIVVSDNDDMPPELEAALAKYDVRRVPFKKKFNLSVKLNDGAAASTGDYVLLLNDDIEVISPDWVEEMLSFSQLPGVGAVGCQLLFPDGLIQHAGVLVQNGNPGHPFYRFPADYPGYYFSTQVHRNYSAVTGACVMCPREAYFSVGGFSPDLPLNYNDVDFCLKLREKGLRVVYTPYARLFHHESVSKSGTTSAELRKFHDLWKKKVGRDPFYNPNLSDYYHDYRIEP